LILASLFLLAGWIPVWRLQATGWTKDLDLINSLVFYGLILGIFLGISLFEIKQASWLCFGYSVVVLLWRLGLILPDTTPLREKVLSIAGRLAASIGQLAHNLPVYDPILFLGSMMLLFWLIGLIGGFQIVRSQQPWFSLAAASAALFLFEVNSPLVKNRESYIGAFIFMVFLVIGRAYYLKTRFEWEKKDVTVDADMGFNHGRSVFLVILLLVLIVWNLPDPSKILEKDAISQRQTVKIWENLRDRFQNIIASLESNTQYVDDQTGNEIELGTSTPLSDEIVFTARPSLKKPVGFRYYWRSRGFDTYQDGSWQNTVSAVKNANPDDWPLDIRYPQEYQQITTTFWLAAPSSRAIFIPGVPISVSRPVRVIGEPIGDDLFEITAIFSEAVLLSGEQYDVNAAVNAPTIVQMRSSGRDYPDWVKARYMQLPDSLSLKISDLANQISGDFDNPYDQVAAVTSFLRKSIVYSASIPSPPSDQDPIVWFLFTQKEGYCFYSATAEVLLLRSLGIPSRLAVGYSQGELDKISGKFTIRQKDSHAWPEVYFSGLGWVSFEPTSSQPELEYTFGQEDSNIPGGVSTSQNGGERLDTQQDREPEFGDEVGGLTNFKKKSAVFWAILSAVGLACASWIVFLFRRRRLHALPLAVVVVRKIRKRGWSVPNWLEQWAEFSSLSRIERLFLTVTRLNRLNRVHLPSGATPTECIDALVERFPSARTPAYTLLQEYHCTVFSPLQGSESSARHAAWDVWRIVISCRLNELTKSLAKLVSNKG